MILTGSLHGLVNCSNEQYHSGPGLSKSMLDAIAISPLNFWDKYLNPDREPEEFKHCFAVGDGTHKLVLEPGTFEQTYAVGFDKSAFPSALDSVAELKKACAELGLMVSGSKPELAERLVAEGGLPRDRILYFLEQEHARSMTGKKAIDARSYKNMLGMLRAIGRDPWAAGMLLGAKIEQSFFWTDHNGILRKCRTDLITGNGEWIGDLKTTDDVSEYGFGRTIAQRRYHVQAAWYLDILRALYGVMAPRGFAFIAVQKTRPYDVAVHYLTDEQIEAGRRLYMQDYARLLHCLDTDTWPGVANGDLLQAKLPGWALH